MTKKEAISWLEELTFHEGEDVPIYDTDIEAINMAIKALEQEPCEDAVSRKAVIDTIFEKCFCFKLDGIKLLLLQRAIEALPSVTPQEPKSEWEHDHEILKAYSNGANEVLDKIRAEIEAIIGEHNWDDYDFCSGLICARKIIDKYRTESEEV